MFKFSFFRHPFLSQLALGGCVECVMRSVTRAHPQTVEHVMPSSARAQPRTIFPSVRLFPGFVKFVSQNSVDSLNLVRT